MTMGVVVVQAKVADLVGIQRHVVLMHVHRMGQLQFMSNLMMIHLVHFARHSIQDQIASHAMVLISAVCHQHIILSLNTAIIVLRNIHRQILGMELELIIGFAYALFNLIY